MAHKQQLAAAAFWLLLWQAVSAFIDNELFLVSPLRVLYALSRIAVQSVFWHTLLFSSVRIGAGFAAGAALGTLLGLCAARFAWLRTLLAPFMLTVRSIPLASFVILALLWVGNAGRLAVLVTMLMAAPVFYQNVLSGTQRTTPQVRRMARAYRLHAVQRLRYITLPAAAPDFYTACHTAAGLCWKSGVAAELIGMTNGSIGNRLYEAKLLFATDELLAWTAVIVCLSLLFERAVCLLARRTLCALMHVRDGGGKACPGISREIQLNDLWAGHGAKPVIQGLCTHIAPGTLVCVAAASGAGKSTLLDVLCGLLAPMQGSCTTQPAGVLFQHDSLLDNLNAIDNIALVTQCAKADICHELNTLGLTNEQLYRPVHTLSGGQRRRVALLRALLADGADILLLDEPFQGLDAEAERAARCSILRLRCGRTVLQTAHDPALALSCNAQLVSGACLTSSAAKKD